MEPEVQNITDVLPGHRHPGPPSYVMYAQGCRHADCLVAFNEYKLRLAQRKLVGEYRDLRLRENRLRDAAEQFAEQHRPVVPEPTEGQAQPVVSEPAALTAGSANPTPDTAATDDLGPVEEVEETDESGTAEEATLSADAKRVRKYLTIGRDKRCKINPTMMSSMPGVLRIGPDRCQAIFNELEAAGLLGSAEKDIYLFDEPGHTEPAPAAKPSRTSSTPTPVYEPGTGIRWVSD